MRNYFTVGADITWKQYRAKGESVAVIRTGAIWADAPAFPGSGGAHVWVVPNEKYKGEKSAIAVRVYRSGARRGEAEIYEDTPAYREYSLKEVTSYDDAKGRGVRR